MQYTYYKASLGRCLQHEQNNFLFIAFFKPYLRICLDFIERITQVEKCLHNVSHMCI